MTRPDLAVSASVSYLTAIVAMCAMLLFGAAPAWAGAGDAGAKSFIETNVAHGIAILKNKSLSTAQRHEQIRDLLSNALDTKKIGLFALGAARAKASPADLADYVTAFNNFMIESYVMRLGGYGGQTLKMTGVIDHAPGDYIVQSVLVDPANPDDPDAVHVDFRVLREADKYAIVDASIAGVWLGLAQRDDFTGFLGQHNDSVPLLTSHLKEMTAGFEKPQSASN